MLTRRRVLQGLVAGALSAVAAVGGVLAAARRRRARPARVTLPVPATDGIEFHGEVILVRTGPAVVALSSRCAHLGCRIDRAAGGLLVCPCHGSKFDPSGRRVTGPATRDLSPLPVALRDQGDKVDVELS